MSILLSLVALVFLVRGYRVEGDDLTQLYYYSAAMSAAILLHMVSHT